MEEVTNGILIREVETKNIMTKSSLPVGGYSVNPYVGCTHACKYCYASFSGFSTSPLEFSRISSGDARPMEIFEKPLCALLSFLNDIFLNFYLFFNK